MWRWYRWWWHRWEQRPIDELVASLAGFLGILLLIWLGQNRNGYAVIFRSALAGGVAVLGVWLIVAQFKRYPERRRGLFLRLGGYLVVLILLAELFQRWL